ARYACGDEAAALHARQSPVRGCSGRAADDSVGEEARDALRGMAELDQHVCTVGAEKGRGPVEDRRRRLEVDERTGHEERAERGMDLLDHRAALAERRLGEQLLEPTARRRGHARARETLEGAGAREIREQ